MNRLATVIFDQLLVYVNLHQHAKNHAISLISSGYMVDKKNLAIWLAENILAHISGTKIFPNMEFVQQHRKQDIFSL